MSSPMLLRMLAVVALYLLLTPAFGQAQRVPRSAPSPSLDEVLFDLTNNMGMLKGPRQVEAIATLEFWAKGFLDLNGVRCDLADYRGSINYQFPGMREEFTCNESGKPIKHIRVVSGGFAWNEGRRGLDPTPAMDAAEDRTLFIWASPQGAVKSARRAGTATKMTTETGKIVLTFPAPSLSGVTLKATLDSKDQV